SICMESGCDVVTRCGHVFHRDCIEAVLKTLGRGSAGQCPLCRGPIKKAELLEKPAELEVVEGDDDGSIPAGASAKIKAVLAFLENNVVKKNDEHLQKPHKAVVFSQFTSVLNLVQTELSRRNLPFVRLDGSMKHEQRVQAQQSFAGHGHIQVMLCSLKAAGTGLNLTAADFVLLIDPWWNPAVEDQAIDRLHRLGQRRPVRALRFVAERTVEERILDVQKQKRAIVEGALSKKSRDEIQKIRLEMMASIFEPM
ncbi:RAD5A, partial [Symbiodinium pilosum]